jgi:integrase
MKSGVIEQRHGRGCSGAERCGCPWSYRVDAPEAIDGKRRQIRKGGYPTKTAAREALADVQRRLANGEQIGGSLTVAAYLEDWLKAKATAGRRASTLAQYRIYVDNYLEPVLGHVRLSDLRAKHVDALLAKMESEGRGLPTQHRVLAALSSALSTAERRRLVSSNVCRQVEIAPERTPTRPVYDGKQLAKFLAHVDADRLAALWRLYAVAGLRRGEALALTWSTVNFDSSTIRIERSLGVVDGRLTWGPPKSESGLRTVAVDATSLGILRTHRARQNVDKLALGAGYVDDDLVFAREDGAALRPEYVSKRFHTLTDGAKLPTIHLHDLRHSAASMALVAGVPMKVVSENLGHSSFGITANVYSHVTSELAKDSAEKVASALAQIAT